MGADEITAQTTDSTWEPCFSRDPSNRHHRAQLACPPAPLACLLIQRFSSCKLCGLVALTVWCDGTSEGSEQQLMELDGKQFVDFMSK